MPIIVVLLVGDWQGFHRRPMLTALARNAMGRANFLFVNPPFCPWIAALSRRRSSISWLGSRIEQLTTNTAVFTPRVWLHERLAKGNMLTQMYRSEVSHQVKLALIQLQIDNEE